MTTREPIKGDVSPAGISDIPREKGVGIHSPRCRLAVREVAVAHGTFGLIKLIAKCQIQPARIGDYDLGPTGIVHRATGALIVVAERDREYIEEWLIAPLLTTEFSIYDYLGGRFRDAVAARIRELMDPAAPDWTPNLRTGVGHLRAYGAEDVGESCGYHEATQRTLLRNDSLRGDWSLMAPTRRSRAVLERAHGSLLERIGGTFTPESEQAIARWRARGERRP